MSWGKSAKGTAAEVREAIATWAKSVEETDRTYAAEEVTQLHGAQVAKVVEATEAFIAAAPDGYAFTVQAGGHAAASTTEVQSDQWYANLGAYKPVPVAGS